MKPTRSRLLAWLVSLVFSTVTFAQTWRSEDIGTVGRPGYSADFSGVVEVVGSGADIWETADGFHFRHFPWSGNGEIVARVISQEATHPWAKVGVMIRESTAAGARHAFMCVTPGNGTAFQSRNATGGGSASTAATGSAILPVWVRVVRNGDTLTGFTSSNGTTWTQAGTVTFTGLAANVAAGIAVTSHDASVTSAARVDNVRVLGADPGPPPAGAPVVSARSPTSVNSGYVFTYQIAATNNPTSYSATGLPAGLTLNTTTGEIRGVCGGNGGTYYATLSATNASGTGSVTQIFQVTGGGPIEMPYIRQVSLPADGTYRPGDTLLIRVLVANGYGYPHVSGQPRIPITLGSNARYGNFAWGGGDQYHTYSYTITSADVGSAGLRTSDTIDLNGGTIADSYPLACALNFTPVNAAGIRVEAGAAPTTTPVLTTPDTATALFARGFTLRITTTGTPTSYGLSYPSTPTRPLGLAFDSNTGTLTGTLQASGRYVLTLRATNAAGTGSKTVTLIVPHAIARVEMPAAGTYRAGDALLFRPVFSNPVRITGAPQIAFYISGTTRFASYVSGSDTTHEFRYIVQPGDVSLEGSIGLSGGILLNGGTVVDAETGENFATHFPRNQIAQGVIVDAPNQPVPVITSGTSAVATLGQPFSYRIVASNSPTSYNASSLPPGLTVNAGTGVISGSPTTAGSYDVYLWATNAGGAGQGRLNIFVSNGSTPALQSTDVGTVGNRGNASESNGVITVQGSGADIWDRADGFYFRAQQLNGDGEIVVRLTSLTNTHPWAKAGIMFRESMDPGARNVFLCMTGANGSAFQWRPMQSGPTEAMLGYDASTFPIWLRLVRTGNDFNAYVSRDGTTWTSRGTGLGPLPSTMLVGLAVTSHSDGTLATAVFDNFRSSGTPPVGPGIPAAPDSLTLYAESARQINVHWADRSANESGFEVERSTDGTTFARVHTTAANATSFADTGVLPATSYTYRVRSVNTQGVSAYTTVRTAVTPEAPPPPTTWDFADVGSVGIAGSNTSSGSTITINGSGHDIWENADGFRFVYRPLYGSGMVEARISSMTDTHSWAKAGVMIRHTLAADSRNVFMFATPNNGIAVQARAVTGAATTFTPGPWANAPYWVRLVRNGNRITAYASPDALTWTEIAAHDIEMAAMVYVGFAVTSHDNSRVNTAVFTDPFVAQ